MSLASKPTGNKSGTNLNNNANGSKINLAHPFVTQAQLHQISSQTSTTSKCSNNVLINMFNNGFSVPRQMTVQARGALDNATTSIHLSFLSTIGQGTFGQIEKARLTVSNASSTESGYKNSKDKPVLYVAVKRVLQDPRYKNRELGIMQRLNNHPNIVKFHYYFYSTSSTTNRGYHRGGRGGYGNAGFDVFLHLILECFPESLCDLIQRYLLTSDKIPISLVRIFTYQILKALAYLHNNQICHRDIKSSNLLVNEQTAVVKVCDFGSAKEMVPGTASVSYISSRYYRAPELLFGSQLYTCAIDTWSGGCVLAEMLRLQCLFTGADSVDQLVKVVRVLGTPSVQDVSSMNPMYGTYRFPNVHSCPIKLFFPKHAPSDMLDLLTKMLVYNPTLRISPAQAMNEPCFDELKNIGPNGMLRIDVSPRSKAIPMPPSIFDDNLDCKQLDASSGSGVKANGSGKPAMVLADGGETHNGESDSISKPDNVVDYPLACPPSDSVSVASSASVYSAAATATAVNRHQNGDSKKSSLTTTTIADTSTIPDPLKSHHRSSSNHSAID